MPTPDKNKAALEGLIAKANAATGGDDATVTDAVDTLIAGFGQGGGGSADILIGKTDVTFYDYDGTIIANYTQEQVAALAELPVPPAHDGLVFQEWNWTLEEIKALGRRAIVGANYDTADGKTRVHLNITRADCLTLGLSFVQTDDSGVTVDWGDGSSPEIPSPVDGVTYPMPIYTHTYPALGEYIITLDCTNGTYRFSGINNQSGGYEYDVITAPYKTYYGNKKYNDCVVGLEIGRKCTRFACRSVNLKKVNVPTSIVTSNYLYGVSFITISRQKNLETQALTRGYGLETVSIPGNAESLGINCFEGCELLRNIVIPDSVKSIANYCFSELDFIGEIMIPGSVASLGSNCFYRCYKLVDVTIQDGVTTLGNLCFDSCAYLRNIVIPDSVTSMGNNCFNDCTNLRDIVIPDSVTSMGNNCFANVSEAERIICRTPSVSFGNNCFAFNAANQSQSIRRYIDFTAATVNDGVLSYTFGTNVFNNIKAGTIIMFKTAEIAEVAKATTNLSQYADYIHYIGEEGIEW